jgi:hypothetical protein
MSNQNLATPWSFVKAVERHFDIKFRYDMAAAAINKKAPHYVTKRQNALAIDWPLDGWCWLNPPFENLTDWIRKCRVEKGRGCQIVTVWPLSGDLNQITTWQEANVNIIHGRIWPTVRACMLCKWDIVTHTTPHLPVQGLRWENEELAYLWG